MIVGVDGSIIGSGNRVDRGSLATVEVLPLPVIHRWSLGTTALVSGQLTSERLLGRRPKGRRQGSGRAKVIEVDGDRSGSIFGSVVKSSIRAVSDLATERDLGCSSTTGSPRAAYLRGSSSGFARRRPLQVTPRPASQPRTSTGVPRFRSGPTAR